MKMRIIYIGIIILCFFSCETEIDVSVDSTAIPVVYGLVELPVFAFRTGRYELPQIDPCYIKLGKSYSGSQKPYLTAKIIDSLYFKDANVKFEYYCMGNIISETLLEKTTSIIKNPGIFSDDLNILYKTTPHLVPARMDTVRLVIELADGKMITSAVPKRASPVLFSPSWKYQIGREISLYEEDPFEIIWYDFGGYYELDWKVNYTDYYHSGTQTQKSVNYRRSIVSERKVEFNYLNWIEIYDWESHRWYNVTNGSKKLTMIYHPENFYSFIKMNIEADSSIQYRRFNNIEFRIYNAEKVYDEYKKFGETRMDLNQNFTNINNGIGIFSCISSRVKSDIQLKKQSLDSLARGQYTRHLKFVSY